MLRIPLLLLIAAMAACPSVAADPVVRVINFTAGWCPLCRVLDPRLEDAVASFESRGIALIELDMTHLTPIDDAAHRALDRSLQTRAMEHGVGYLWDWYGEHAGIAVIVAADNGEPLTCIRSALTTAQIEDLLQESLILATRVRPGRRRLDGTDCPVPIATAPDFKPNP